MSKYKEIIFYIILIIYIYRVGLPEWGKIVKGASHTRKVRHKRFRTFPWPSDGDLEFNLDHELQGYLQVRSIFLIGTPLFDLGRS